MSNRRASSVERWRIPAWVAFTLVTMLLTPANATGQTLRGSVLEEGRKTPVPGATISLVDRSGEHRAEAISDSVGRFLLAPPEAGEYVVEAVGLGYAPTSSPLFSMTLEGDIAFDLMMRPNPIGLEGFEVSVEPVDMVAQRVLRGFGHTPASLGNRWIDRGEIEKRPMNRLSGIVRWQNIPGARVPVGGSPATESLCVIFRQRGVCALTILNGAVIDELEVNQLDPGTIEAIAILRPMDAATFYGTRAGGGAVLLWTREGGR